MNHYGNSNHSICFVTPTVSHCAYIISTRCRTKSFRELCIVSWFGWLYHGETLWWHIVPLMHYNRDFDHWFKYHHYLYCILYLDCMWLTTLNIWLLESDFKTPVCCMRQRYSQFHKLHIPAVINYQMLFFV